MEFARIQVIACKVQENIDKRLNPMGIGVKGNTEEQ